MRNEVPRSQLFATATLKIIVYLAIMTDIFLKGVFYMRLCKIFLGALLTVMMFVAPANAQRSSGSDDPSGFVVLSEVVPDII